MKNGIKKSRISAQFTIDYWRDNDWYVGRLREVPSVMSQGASLDELVENIKDAYSMILQDSRKSMPSRTYRSKKVSLVF